MLAASSQRIRWRRWRQHCTASAATGAAAPASPSAAGRRRSRVGGGGGQSGGSAADRRVKFQLEFGGGGHFGHVTAASAARGRSSRTRQGLK
jgi:hypothetical protein